jgi:hypothetical protein
MGAKDYPFMRIKKFILGSHTVNVKYVRDVIDPDTGEKILGLCNPLTNTILVATHFKGEKLAEDVVMHSLNHETVHYILSLMGETELNNNENFVDMVGGYIYQYIKTKK